MALTWDEIQANAVAFSKRWEGAHSEKSESDAFVRDFLRIFGIDDPRGCGTSQYKVLMSNGAYGWIDFLSKDKIAIEMKSLDKSLDKAYNQILEYMQRLPATDVPDLWMVSDFETIRLWKRSTKQFWEFKTAGLRQHIKKFAVLIGSNENVRDTPVEADTKAARKMAELHNAMEANGYSGHDLEVYLVRLLFCLFADSTGIFPKDAFHDYVYKSDMGGGNFQPILASFLKF